MRNLQNRTFSWLKCCLEMAGKCKTIISPSSLMQCLYNLLFMPTSIMFAGRWIFLPAFDCSSSIVKKWNCDSLTRLVLSSRMARPRSKGALLKSIPFGDCWKLSKGGIDLKIKGIHYLCPRSGNSCTTVVFSCFYKYLRVYLTNLRFAGSCEIFWSNLHKNRGIFYVLKIWVAHEHTRLRGYFHDNKSLCFQKLISKM